MDAPSYQDLFRIARDEMLTRSSRITKDVAEREGTDVNAILAAIAACGDEVAAHVVRVCSANILDSARGDALVKLAFDRYGITKKPASVALGSVSFSTATAASASFAIPEGTMLTTSDGRQFATTVAASFSAGSVGPVVVAVRSVLAGLQQQVPAGVITSISSAIVGAPSNLAVTNTLATSGGSDGETEDELRERCRQFFKTVSKGTLAAVRTAALAYPGVQKASVFEELDELGRPARASQLVITDAFTDALVNTSSATYQTQSQVLADSVFAALDDVRACGIFVDVFVAQVVLQPVVLALSFQAGADVETAALQARAAIVAYVNALSPGEAFSPPSAVEALRLVPGLLVTGTEILSPPGPVAAASRQVLRTTMSLVRASTLQPDRALQGSTNADGLA